jgi:hypothetical protein
VASQGKPMTIAAAFPCKDGLILCADTQETITGYVKTNTQKIRVMQGPHYSMVFTGAGDADLFEMTVDEIDKGLTRDKVGTGAWNIEESIKKTLAQIFKKVISPWAAFPNERPSIPKLLIGLQYPAATLLYEAHGTMIRRCREPECVGMGVILGKSLSGQLFHDGLSLTQGALVAVYILHQAKQWVDGCGGNSDIVLLSDRDMNITRMPTDKVRELETHFDMFNMMMRDVLIATADASIPYSNFAQIIKQFQLNMLQLHSKFMEMEEFIVRLYELTGFPIPPELQEKAKAIKRRPHEKGPD